MKVTCRVVALGGKKGLGANHAGPDCGHFLPDKCPDEMAYHDLELVKKIS